MCGPAGALQASAAVMPTRRFMVEAPLVIESLRWSTGWWTPTSPWSSTAQPAAWSDMPAEVNVHRHVGLRTTTPVTSVTSATPPGGPPSRHVTMSTRNVNGRNSSRVGPDARGTARWVTFVLGGKWYLHAWARHAAPRLLHGALCASANMHMA